MVASPRLADLNMNDRALIVHQHLARRDGPTVSTTAEAGLRIKAALERDVRLVSCEDGRLEIALEQGAARTLVNELSRKLTAWTGRPWMVVVSREAGAPTLKAQADMRDAERKRGVRGHPLVQAVLERFPGAEIVAVRGPDSAPPAGEAELPGAGEPDEQ